MQINKIGLVTFYKSNYGSALQCYASKITIEKLGYKCEVLEKKKSVYEKFFRKMHLYLIQVKDKQSRKRKYFITNKSRKKIGEFVDHYIIPQCKNSNELKKIGKDRKSVV